MRIRLGFVWTLLGATLFCAPSVDAQTRHGGSSLLNDDPEVVYAEEFTEKQVDLLVAKPATVFATRKGGRKLGTLKENTKVRLLGITEKAYQVRGTSVQSRGISGWVSPQLLASKDKDFIVNFQKVFNRQKEVRELIDNNEVAIGMSLDEVVKSQGEPTKTKIRQTAKGKTGSWEFIQFAEQDHYSYVRDPFTGRLYRQYSHTTQEELGKVVVEFENEVVTAIEESENRGGRRIKIVVPPVVFTW